MKRLRVILLFLLLGATVNVAVAWGIALNLTITDDPNDAVNSTFWTDEESWLLERWEGFGTILYLSNRYKVPYAIEEAGSITGELVKPNWGSMDVTTSLYQTLPGPPDHPRVKESRVIEARGWPMLSLWCQRNLYVVDGTDIKQFGPRAMIAIPILHGDDWGPRGFPLHPIWTGFVFNMLLYATILWLLYSGPLFLHRFIRRKRGLCVKCAYDLRGVDHQACPECGAAT